MRLLRAQADDPREEAAAKIRAAVDGRSDPDFVFIARRDALAGLSEKFRRYQPLETVWGLGGIEEMERRYKVS